MTDTTKTEALRLAAWLLDNVTHLNHAEAAAELRRLSEVEAERDRLRAALAASCDEERNQIWEAGPGGGCMRALEAESERDRLAAECEALRAALSAILKSPTGCQFCDYGKPRLSIRTGSPCEHDDGCGFVLAHAAMGGEE